MSIGSNLLEKYQIRKTKAQKTAFIEYVKGFAANLGYPLEIKGKGDSVRNIVIGNLERAEVVYTAHYDTPPVMILPNFITPKNFLIYLAYQLFLVALMLVLPLGAALALKYTVFNGVGSFVPLLVFLLLYYAELYLMMYGPANKHNANDNTSGVATVLGIMERLAGKNLDVAFVLFDCEERGLLGSKMLAKQKKNIMKDKLVVNFDCVSEGDKMLFAVRKGAVGDLDLLRSSFASRSGIECLCESRGVFYPSDQSSFKRGVGVASLRRGMLGVLYTSRIHTPRDTVFDEGNIEFLVSGSERLAWQICAK